LYEPPQQCAKKLHGRNSGGFQKRRSIAVEYTGFLRSENILKNAIMMKREALQLK
jgi:hypothetical protein